MLKKSTHKSRKGREKIGEVYSEEMTGKYKNKYLDISSNTSIITTNINGLNAPPRQT